ncbi:trypsin-like serine peptidase [Staphylococcus rostri]|nr:trypsin-like serine protease [Staphylococcus rostri]
MRNLNYIKVPLILTGLYFVYPTQVTHASELPEASNTVVATQDANQEKHIQNQDGGISEIQPTQAEKHLEATPDTYAAQLQTFEADEVNDADDEPEETFTYDTSKDPNYDKDGDLIDNRKKLTGDAVKPNTAFVHTDNANYKGEIESLKGGDGSGAVIGKNLILTAGHVVYNNNYPRDYMTGGYVIPGKDGDNEPYGRFKIKAMHVPEKYKEMPYRRYDMGIIELEPNEKGQSIGDLIKPYAIKPFDKGMLGKKVYSQGYPIEKNEKTKNQWYADGTLIQVQDQGTIEYSMHNSEGQSGGPVFLDNTEEIIAVHTYGLRGNDYGTLGTPITPELYAWINSFLEKEPPIKPIETTPQDEDVVKPPENHGQATQTEGAVKPSEGKDEKTQTNNVAKPANKETINETAGSEEQNTVQQTKETDVPKKVVSQKENESTTTKDITNMGVKSMTTASMSNIKPTAIQTNVSRANTYPKVMSSNVQYQASNDMPKDSEAGERQLSQTGRTSTNTSSVMGLFLALAGAIVLTARRKFKNM